MALRALLICFLFLLTHRRRYFSVNQISTFESDTAPFGTLFHVLSCLLYRISCIVVILLKATYVINAIHLFIGIFFWGFLQRVVLIQNFPRSVDFPEQIFNYTLATLKVITFTRILFLWCLAFAISLVMLTLAVCPPGRY